MSTTLTIRDETAAGQTLGEIVVELLTERVTVRELIRSRVYQEVQDYNIRRPEYYRGLVQPTDAETTLNGFKLRRPGAIDGSRQFERAIEAFQHTRIVVLVNDRQAESLDEEIEVGPGTKVSFIKLVPLAGG